MFGDLAIEEAIALTEENALRCGVRDRLTLHHGTAKDTSC